jgi:NAD(P)H-hydrate epimerase
LRALGEIKRLWDDADAVAIGPGLSMHHETQELVRRLVMRRVNPTVVDADGLNACAKEIASLETPAAAPLIITPHVGEMARLLHCEVAVVMENRQAAAQAAARRFHCIVVMKGAPTFVAGPDGDLYLNPTGNSGMASGGVGDVLTGIIVSLLAQGGDPLYAAMAGVYLHGLAGDQAATGHGGRSLIAGDIVRQLPATFDSLIL